MGKKKTDAGADDIATFAPPVTISREALLKHGSDHRFRKLLYDFEHLGKLLDRSRSHLAAEIGLTPPQYNILMVVAEHQKDQGISVGDIAKSLHVTGAFVTTQIHRLVAANMVEKIANPDDGRSILVRLAPQGRAEIKRVAPIIRDFNDAFFAPMSRAGFKQFSATVASLIETGEQALLGARVAQPKPPKAAALGKKSRAE